MPAAPLPKSSSTDFTFFQVAEAKNLPFTGERILPEKQFLPLPTMLQVAIAVPQGDSVHFLGAVCMPEGIRYFDNRTAVFETGSITKVFTATLLAE